jgi:small subunit ribosomal protein S20
MPNIKSAIKRVKIEKKKTLNNNVKKSEYKTAVRKFEKALAEKSEDAKELMKNAQKAIDHACSSGVISKNAASRKVSKLEKKLAVNADNKTEKKAE